MPIISIVTVCKNSLLDLKKTYESIIVQKSKEFEWIVIDGLSTDGTVQWLDGLKITYLKLVSELDSGIYDAMNKGVALSSGEYVVFMNAGDMFFDCETLIQVLDVLKKERDECLFLYGDSIDVDMNGVEKHRPARSVKHTPIGMFSHHQAMYFQRHFIQSFPYPEKYLYSGDYALVSWIYKNTNKIVYLPFPLCKFILGGAHQQNRIKAMFEDYEIRKEILKMNKIFACSLFVAHFFHKIIKQMLPTLYGNIRYGK